MEYAAQASPDASEANLHATGFALLAQFAREPASAYALAQSMRRNLHYLWPRAESRIYAEVQRLRERGFLRGEAQSTGRRARTVLHITPAGRRALAAWMRSPVTPGLVLESEALLRVFFATLGSRDDLLRALERLHADTLRMREVATDVGRAYLGGTGAAQEQAHVRALIHALLGRLALLVEQWVGECTEEVQRWPDLGPENKRRAAARRFSATQRDLTRGAK